MSRVAPTSFVAILGTAAFVVSTLAGGIAGVNRAAAQGGTPVATPVGDPSCTADLGIVRSTKTCVNVVHASPDAPPVDVLLNGEATVEGLNYGSASGFASVPAGTSQFQIVLSGEGLEVTVINIADFELVAGRAYEVALVGSLASIEAVVNEVNVYEVEGTSRAGSTRIRLINTAS